KISAPITLSFYRSFPNPAAPRNEERRHNYRFKDNDRAENQQKYIGLPLSSAIPEPVRTCRVEEQKERGCPAEYSEAVRVSQVSDPPLQEEAVASYPHEQNPGCGEYCQK